MAGEGSSEQCRSRAGNNEPDDTYGPIPRDLHPNIAMLRGKHRAAHPDGVSTLQVESHVLMVNEWPMVCPRFIEALKIAGVHCLPRLCYIRLDHHLLTALIERWCPQTNTFHLAVGEMTITLEDVAMILGVQVDGPPMVGPPVVGVGRRWQNWPDCCDDLLGSHPGPDVMYHDPSDVEITANFKMGQARTKTCVPLRWLRWTFQRHSYIDLNEIEFRRHVRGYILFLIGSFLLPDTSGNEVHLQFLPLLEDLEFFSRFSLGGAILAHLYRELNEATKPKRLKLSSCVHLLQIWSWEHLHIGRPLLHVPVPDDMFGFSVGLRWSCTWAREMPVCNLRMYRDEFDGLLQSQVIWEPYTARIRHHVAEICSAGAAIWLSRVPVICWKRVEWYLPDRVLRQFGCLPNIDVLPIDQNFVRVDGRGKADTDWSAYHSKYINLWQNRRSAIVTITPATEGREKERAIKRYMRWYKSWASLFLLKAPSEPPQTYYPHATTERQLRDIILTADQLFQPFYGSQDDTDQQNAINKFQDLMITANKQMFISDTSYRDTYDDVGAGPSSYERLNDPQVVADAAPSAFAEDTMPQPFVHYMSAGPSSISYPTGQQQYGVGVPSQFQSWPSFEMNWGQPTTSTFVPQQGFFAAPTWMTPGQMPHITQATIQGNVRYQHDVVHTDPAAPDEEPGPPGEEQRARRRPDKYTPGSNAIPRRKGKKK